MKVLNYIILICKNRISIKLYYIGIKIRAEDPINKCSCSNKISLRYTDQYAVFFFYIYCIDTIM